MPAIATDHIALPLEAGLAVPAYRAAPAAGQPVASVLVLSEIWSVNPNIRSICERLAQNGIVALAPDLYRGGPAPQESDPAEAITQFLPRLRRARGHPRRARLHALAAGARPRRRAASTSGASAWGGGFAHYLDACGEPVAGMVNHGRLVFERQPNKPFIPDGLCGLIEVPYPGCSASSDPVVRERDVETLRASFVAHVRESPAAGLQRAPSMRSSTRPRASTIAVACSRGLGHHDDFS
ncbi:MAG: dienelactone hydrolase family protein [Betaproteobacteria bacterium]|nr:dienelactone hydrolase family protein [Betaproteobacteria bacterium]